MSRMAIAFRAENIGSSGRPLLARTIASTPGERNAHNHAFVDEVTELNVKQVVARIRTESPVLKALEDEGKIRIVGALYDTSSGKVAWY